MRRQRRQFQSIIGEQKLLVTGVPQPCKLPLPHDRGSDGHPVEVVRPFAKLRAAAVFFDAHHSARAPHRKPQRRETLDRFWREPLFDIPHGLFKLMNARHSVKRTLNCFLSWRLSPAAGESSRMVFRSDSSHCNFRFYLYLSFLHTLASLSGASVLSTRKPSIFAPIM